jgi:SAM-dependent methyltransferase
MGERGRQPAPSASAGESLQQRVAYHLAEFERMRLVGPDDPMVRMTTPFAGRVLEVGCGLGQVLRSLGRGARPELLVGVDVDLELLRMKGTLGDGQDSGSGLPMLVAGDALSLPFSNEAFDLVICRVVLMSLPVDRALRELARVVRPGGRIYLHLTGPGFYLQDLGRGRWKGSMFALLNGTLLTLFSMQVRLAGLWNNYETAKYVEKRLAEEGFTVVLREKGRRRWLCPIAEKLLAVRAPAIPQQTHLPPPSRVP